MSTPRAGRRPSVAVFGGGIAGLTAAQELAERDFAVSVHEAGDWGGKARSTSVEGTATGSRRPLPSEHGYRLEFGYYRNLPDTMARIPLGAGPGDVRGNLVPCPQSHLARHGRRSVTLPMGSLDPRPFRPDQIVDMLSATLVERQIRPAAAAFYASRFALWASSCDGRRAGELESISWLDYIRADVFGDDYRLLLGDLPRFAVASRPADTAASFVARFQELQLYSVVGRGATGPTIQVLDGPTSEVWFDPWTAHLERLGVALHRGDALEGFTLEGGHVAHARVRGPGGVRAVTADAYVCALPVDRARRLWDADVLRADPRLAAMHELPTAWMNGIMFYLSEEARIARGVVACIDSPWTVSFVCQAQFWSEPFAATYGDGSVHDKLSAVIAEWDAPGVVHGKPARECTRDELIEEVWAQITMHVNARRPRLRDDMVVAVDVDPGLRFDGGRVTSDEPLVMPTKGTARHRPGVATAIPDLVLAGDYLDGHWEVSSMEAACYNGRRAAQAVLERSGRAEAPVTALEPYVPREWAGLRAHDARRHAAGLPNLFDSVVRDPRARRRTVVDTDLPREEAMSTMPTDPLGRGPVRRGLAEVRDFTLASAATIKIPGKLAQAMIGIDMRRWNRFYFLHVAVTTGLLEELADGPLPRRVLADRLGVKDEELFGSLIDIGKATHDLRETSRGVALRGTRARHLWRDGFEGWRGFFDTEATYNAEVYAAFADRLRGAPKGDYFPRFADPLAQGVRAVEWFQAPYVLRHAGRDRPPATVYDAGVGSGLYLRYLSDRYPAIRGKGVDMDPTIIEETSARLERWGLADRFTVAVEDFADPASDPDRYDLVIMFHNLYFFDDESRQPMFDTLAQRLTPDGRLIVGCYLDGRGMVARDMDVLLRSTVGCYGLPSVEDTATMLRKAGLEIERLDRIAPFMPFYGFVCRPARA